MPHYSSRATADFNVAGAFGNHTHCIYADSAVHTDNSPVPSSVQQNCGGGRNGTTADEDKATRW